jgi:hypothetical protein
MSVAQVSVVKVERRDHSVPIDPFVFVKGEHLELAVVLSYPVDPQCNEVTIIQLTHYERRKRGLALFGSRQVLQ